MPIDDSKFFEEVSDSSPQLEPRCPVVLLLDTSVSMSGAPVTALNSGLRAFKAAMARDARAGLRVEIAVVTIGEAQKFEDFIPAGQFAPPFLQASGVEAIGPAINLALDIVEERVRDYKAAGIENYTPWIFFVTARTPAPSDDAWDEAAQRARDLDMKRTIAFFSVGVEGVDLSVLKRTFTARLPLKLNDLKFKEMFDWLARCLIKKVANSKVDDLVTFEPPFAWAQK